MDVAVVVIAKDQTEREDYKYLNLLIYLLYFSIPSNIWNDICGFVYVTFSITSENLENWNFQH